MVGQSLINGSYRSYPVISVAVAHTVFNENNVEWNPKNNKPPFYQFDKISVIDCHKIYSLNLEKYVWSLMRSQTMTNIVRMKICVHPGR